ncbi:MAG: hypothetical protein AAF824_12890 [Bacteroidota bacterium]
MRTLCFFCLLIIVGPQAAVAQDYAKDVQDIDTIIEVLYAVISGEQNEARDWDRFQNLFIPEARLIPTRKGEEGKTLYTILTPAEYVERFGSRLEENGFYEKEIHRVTETYGSLCHIFTTYESYHSAADTEPYVRGINSIQLMHDGDRWWIIQIYWLGETEENPLPGKYLPN